LKKWKKPIVVLVTSIVISSGFITGEGLFTKPLTVEAASTTTYTVTASTLNVRSGKSTKNKVIGTVKKGTKLSVQKKESNGWYKIKFKNKTGYVSGTYVKKTTSTSNSTSKASTSSTTTYTVTASTLNVRSGKSTKNKVIGSVKKNTKLTVQKKESNGWYKITFKGKTGYVSGSYVKVSSSTTKTQAKKSIVDQVNSMKTLGKSQQVILVTAANSSTKSATIRTFEKANGKWKQVHSISGVVGKDGMTDKMSESSKASPTGKYTIGTAFGRGANPGTKLPYRKITSDDVWVDDPKSSLYNTWQKASKNKGRWKSAEKMNIAEYDLGFVINYNTNKPVAGKGSAIFFHVAGKSGYTLGCTATSKTNVSNILKWLKPDKNPVIIQTPESGLGKY